MLDLPSHLREQPLYNRFCVSKDVLKEYPAFHVGWKKSSWVVIIRGRDIGIFFSIFGMCSEWYNRSNSHCYYNFAACRSFTPSGAFVKIILSLLRIITELPSPAVSCRDLGETKDPSMFLPSGSPADYPFMFIGGQFVSNQDIVDATSAFGCMMLSPDHTLEKLIAMTTSASELPCSIWHSRPSAYHTAFWLTHDSLAALETGCPADPHQWCVPSARARRPRCSFN
jgi:hypothetical protein